MLLLRTTMVSGSSSSRVVRREVESQTIIQTGQKNKARRHLWDGTILYTDFRSVAAPLGT